jgi:hypothetical protein
LEKGHKMVDASNVPRRRLLMRGGVLLGSVLGLGVAGKSTLNRAPAGGALAIRLHGANWQLTYPDRPRGVLPRAGQRSAAFGELFDDAELGKVGEFYASSVQFGAPFGASDIAAGAMEMHQFNLGDGTIIGVGTVSDLYGGSSVHAIIGGTGRYEGASGSYVARQRPVELGGDGTADFELNVMLRSA